MHYLTCVWSYGIFAMKIVFVNFLGTLHQHGAWCISLEQYATGQIRRILIYASSLHGDCELPGRIQHFEGGTDFKNHAEIEIGFGGQTESRHRNNLSIKTSAFKNLDEFVVTLK